MVAAIGGLYAVITEAKKERTVRNSNDSNRELKEELRLLRGGPQLRSLDT